MNKSELAGYFDHTLLKPEATAADVKRICREAVTHGFYAVCVNPCFVELVKQKLDGTSVKTCSVVGFPLGTHLSRIKAAETDLAISTGAQEIDMVIHVGGLKQGDYNVVEDDIKAVVAAAQGRIVKVIIETCYLTDQEKVAACELARRGGAHFVKTSTGFGSGGATLADIALMRKTVGTDLKIKASGGIKTLKQALAMIEAGADRIGASAGVAILEELG